MSIAMLGHPFGAGQVTIEGTSCTIMFTIRVNVQHDSGDLSPVGFGRVGDRTRHAAHAARPSLGLTAHHQAAEPGAGRHDGDARAQRADDAND